MIVTLNRGTGVPVVSEADVLTRLSAVVGPQADLDGLDPAIARPDADGSHLWLRVDWLRNAARPSADAAEWERGFEGMIGYAKSKGWTDETGESVRVHIERT